VLGRFLACAEIFFPADVGWQPADACTRVKRAGPVRQGTPPEKVSGASRRAQGHRGRLVGATTMAEGIIMSSSSSLKLKLALCALAAASFGPAMAGSAQSWNLSRDMYLDATVSHPVTQSDGVWSFMYTASPGVANYQMLSDFQTLSLSRGSAWIWRDANVSPEPAVWVNDVTQPSATGSSQAGVPHLHPAPNAEAVVRWHSPITGTIRLLGRFSAVDRGVGDGVTWRIVHNGMTTPLAQGSVQNTAAGNGDVFHIKNIAVTRGDSLYFVVNAGPHHDSNSDTTDLDVIITTQ
jgi:hypothetical protein